MLKETCLSNVKKIAKEEPDAEFVFVFKPPLKPNDHLLRDYQYWKSRFAMGEPEPVAREKAMRASHYEARYRRQILNDPKALDLLRSIYYKSLEKDVYLVCYEKRAPCHRFILLDIIRTLSRRW